MARAINIEPGFEKKLRKLRVLTKFKKECTKSVYKELLYVDIVGAFIWNDTVDGHQFWCDIEIEIENLNEGG